MNDSSSYIKDYRLWLGSRIFSNLARQMQAVLVAWIVYQITRHPMALGLIGLAEALPFVLTAVWAGPITDRHEKRKIILRADVGLLFGTVLLLGSTFLEKPPLLLYYLVVSLTGFCASFGNISSIAYGQTIVPKEHFPRMAAWNLGTYLGSSVGGPMLGGYLLSHAGPRFAFFVEGVFLVIALIFAAMLRKVHPVQINALESNWQRIKEGVRFIRSQRIILGAMMIDMVAVFFGDVVALYPIFAEMLKTGPLGLGILKASPAIGGGIISITQAMRPFIRPSWAGLKTTIVIFGCSMIAFALAPTLPLAVAALVIGGMADGFSVIIRQSLYQAMTPDHMRGRMAAASSIFISSSNELGAFESGLAATLLGTVPSVIFGGTLTLLSVVMIGWFFRDLDLRRQKG